MGELTIYRQAPCFPLNFGGGGKRAGKPARGGWKRMLGNAAFHPRKDGQVPATLAPFEADPACQAGPDPSSLVFHTKVLLLTEPIEEVWSGVVEFLVVRFSLAVALLSGFFTLGLMCAFCGMLASIFSFSTQKTPPPRGMDFGTKRRNFVGKFPHTGFLGGFPPPGEGSAPGWVGG